MAILIVTHREEDPKTGEMVDFVSHGVNTHTMENVILQQEPLKDVIKEWGLIRFEGGYRMP
jgi:hypothetical protein